jgi:hypothetical protein
VKKERNMKLARKSLSVYNRTGEYLIGTLSCGDMVQEIEDSSAGILIAYIVGLIRTADAVALISPEEWSDTADEKQRFLNFVAAQEEALYVLGAQGQEITPALIKILEHVSVTDRNRALAHYNEHVKTGQTLTAYDCSGLVVKFLLDEGLVPADRSANGLYHNECDDISEDELTAGDLVFKKYLTKNKMYHVGVYMGDGSVVHAKGRDDGVVRESFGKAVWNRFGRLRCWGGTQSIAVYTRLLKENGKPYVKGDDVRGVQRALESKGYDTGGIDGVYGAKTEKAVIAFQQAVGLAVDGIVGPKTWAALIG